MSYLIMCTQLSLVCFHDKIQASRIFMSTCFFKGFFPQMVDLLCNNVQRRVELNCYI